MVRSRCIYAPEVVAGTALPINCACAPHLAARHAVPEPVPEPAAAAAPALSASLSAAALSATALSATAGASRRYFLPPPFLNGHRRGPCRRRRRHQQSPLPPPSPSLLVAAKPVATTVLVCGLDPQGPHTRAATRRFQAISSSHEMCTLVHIARVAIISLKNEWRYKIYGQCPLGIDDQRGVLD